MALASAKLFVEEGAYVFITGRRQSKLNDADSRLQAPADDEIRGASVLSHVVRVLIPHVDHCCANFDPSRLRTNCRKQWEWRCQLARKVMNSKVGSVHSQSLGLDSEVN